LYVYASVDSTNTTAAHLAELGAPEGTLVVADHQRRGRGRGGSRWETPAGSAIAMSLVLRPAIEYPLRWAGLGALAAAEALELDGLAPQIKWPNDILLGGRKVAGVWPRRFGKGTGYAICVGDRTQCGPGSSCDTDFPATTVEEQSGRVDRSRLVARIVGSLGLGRARIGRVPPGLEHRLAYGKRPRERVGSRSKGGWSASAPAALAFSTMRAGDAFRREALAASRRAEVDQQGGRGG
jgi:hypothetical protein